MKNFIKRFKKFFMQEEKIALLEAKNLLLMKLCEKYKGFEDDLKEEIKDLKVDLDDHQQYFEKHKKDFEIQKKDFEIQKDHMYEQIKNLREECLRLENLGGNLFPSINTGL